MHRSLSSLVLALLLAGAGFAANRYIEAGYPGAETKWTVKGYAQAAQLILTKKELPLPTLSDPESAAIFERMTDPGNLSVLESRKTPAIPRFGFLINVEKPVVPIRNAYLKRLEDGSKVIEEYMRLFAFSLHSHDLRGKLLQRLKNAQRPKDRELLQAIVDKLPFGSETIFDYLD